MNTRVYRTAQLTAGGPPPGTVGTVMCGYFSQAFQKDGVCWDGFVQGANNVFSCAASCSTVTCQSDGLAFVPCSELGAHALLCCCAAVLQVACDASLCALLYACVALQPAWTRTATVRVTIVDVHWLWLTLCMCACVRVWACVQQSVTLMKACEAEHGATRLC